MAPHSNITRADPYELITGARIVLSGYVIFLVLGTFINLWFLVSIAKSKELLANLRNQLICNLSVLHLTETLICYPIHIFNILKFFRTLDDVEKSTKCMLRFFGIMMETTQSCIGDWLIVIITAVFLARVLDKDLTRTMKPLALRVGKIVLHVLPWVVAIAATPLSMYSKTVSKSGCIRLHSRHFFAYDLGYTVVPVGVAIVLVALAFLCRRRQSSGPDYQGSVGTQMIGKGPETDNGSAYLLAVVVIIACETFGLVIQYQLTNWRFKGRLFRATARFFNASRVAVLPLVWLLLPDIRDRIKTWRPWHKEHADVDLVTAYNAKDDTTSVASQ